VAQVMVYGAQKYAVRVQMDPKALASRGIGIDEAVSAIQKANVNLPTGTLWGSEQAVTVRASGQLTEAKDYRPVVVAYRGGAPVRLRDIGRVMDSVENDKSAYWFNEIPAIILAIQRQPGTNTVEVVNAVKGILSSLKASIPASVNIDVLYDRSESIRESVADVTFTLLLSIGLVVLVIFLFLRNLSATLIPSLALPISIVGTFAAMYFMDFSINNLSMMALILSVGFVVDDAIVMLENIVRHMELGEGVLEAALNGAREIGFTIVSMTLSLVVVFVPVLFMGGVMGRLLHEFAVTIACAVLISGFVSLTLTPMLCSRFLRPPATQHHGRIYNASERVFQGMLDFYQWSLKRALNHRLTVMVVSAFILIATAYLFIRIPKGFLPSEDTGRIFAITEAAQGISFESMVRHQRELAAIVREDPNVDSFMSGIGGGRSSRANNTGRLFIRLKPRDQRTLSADEVIQKLRPRLATVPGIQSFLQNLPPIRIGGQLAKSQYQFTLQSPDTDALYRYAPLLEAKLGGLKELQDVTSDLEIKNPQIDIEIQRDKAATLGVTAHQIEDALFSAYSSRQISTIFTANNEYQVILELEPRYQLDPSAINMLYIRSASGQLVPLNAIATITRGFGPLTLNHLGQLPAVTISFNVRPGVSLGDGVAMVERVARETLPESISTSFQGTAQAFQDSMRGLGILLLMAILVIYIVLGILYESFIHPLTILSGLPAAGFGALLTLFIFGVDLNVYAFVGVIMLVGLVKKNAIMMIDFALEAERKEGKSPMEAIYQGCIIRFRPIMMTTMAALLGTLPIAIGFGAGGESRQPLGLATVGGLIFSQLLTLYITPVVYTYLDRFQKKISRKVGIFRTKTSEVVEEEVGS
ncbi:MAG: efflux RND transporter permease subunit, partial [Proteobacteria bacterium]|nr:efflux RND transporter permease subunit [Pseudomonadota bacterium]